MPPYFDVRYRSHDVDRRPVFLRRLAISGDVTGVFDIVGELGGGIRGRAVCPQYDRRALLDDAAQHEAGDDEQY